MNNINDKKFCFIICSYSESLLNECVEYINELIIPEGYEIDLMVVSDVDSILKGYEEARNASDAKYKIYIHQDTFIVNSNILFDLLNIFNQDKRIGAVGVKGSKSILGNEVSLAEEVFGECISMNSKKNYCSSRFIKEKASQTKGIYTEAGCLWGCFIATQIDFEWEDVFENDWKYYPIIMSLQIQRKNYKTVVANQEQPWCIHEGNNEGISILEKDLKRIKEKYGILVPNKVLKRVLIVDTEEIAFPAMELALLRLGYSVEVYFENVSSIRYEEELVNRMTEWMKNNDYLFVFTFDYSPNVGEAAQRSNMKYVSWAWDSPLLQYAFNQAQYPTLYACMFDRGEINDLKKLGLKNVLHMPLATDPHVSSLISVNKEDEKIYSHDISFIGKMYDTDIINEYKEKYDEKSINIINQIISEDLCDWNDSRKIYNDLDDCIREDYYKNRESIKIPYYYEKYFQCTFFSNIAYLERVKILNSLAAKYKVDIYTKGDTSELKNINIHGPINSVVGAPKVYRLSKINLNITNRSIKTGVPLRIFEIMGVGGFVISNYQEELAELFEEDKEIVLFKTVDELLDKVSYYLTHDNERKNIAQKGYQKTKDRYNYDVAIEKLLKICQIEM